MENQNIKFPPTPRALRIMEMKIKIRDLECECEMNMEMHDLWITHLKTGWRACVRFPSGGLRRGLETLYLQSIEDCWKDALEVALRMDSDFQNGML